MYEIWCTLEGVAPMMHDRFYSPEEVAAVHQRDVSRGANGTG